MEEKFIYSLLQEVVNLQKNEELISKLRGEHFNVFSTLRKERDEVGLHNRLLTALLDPAGTHGLGDKPLALFLETIKTNDSFGTLSQEKQKLLPRAFVNAQVKDEHNLGRINKDYTVGGSVDIAVLGTEANLFIESKVHAGDQKHQLYRYSNDRSGKSNVIIYLTLDGKDASEDSQNGFTDYLRLSYRDDVIFWLKLVKELATSQPILRETIEQYIILLKKLTGQLYSQQMEEKLLEIITQNAEVYRAAELIKNNFDEVTKTVYKQVFKKLGECTEFEYQTNRDKRIDAAFISLKEEKLEGTTYEIGIWIELSNSMMFFCAIEKGQKRKDWINTQSIFDEVANRLSQKEITIDKEGGFDGFDRNGWRLTSSYSYDFKLNEYLSTSQNEKEEMIKKMGLDIEQLVLESGPYS